MGLLQLLFPKHEEYYSSTHSVAYPMHIKMKKKKKKNDTPSRISQLPIRSSCSTRNISNCHIVPSSWNLRTLSNSTSAIFTHPLLSSSARHLRERGYWRETKNKIERDDDGAVQAERERLKHGGWATIVVRSGGSYESRPSSNELYLCVWLVSRSPDQNQPFVFNKGSIFCFWVSEVRFSVWVLDMFDFMLGFSSVWFYCAVAFEFMFIDFQCLILLGYCIWVYVY
jgi:hypothetical protein